MVVARFFPRGSLGAAVSREEGWAGWFTRAQAPGAIPNGTRIEKVFSEDRDGTPLGTRGTVLGSLPHPTNPSLGTGYFVEFDDKPRVAIFIIAKKIAPVAQGSA